jgi:hypothetical protein
VNFCPPPRKRSRWHRIGLLWLALPAPVRMGVLLVALVLVAFLSGCASTKPEGVQITIPAEEAARCATSGGCDLYSRAEVANIQYQAYLLGQKEALGSDAFDSQGCKRGSI